MSEKSEKDLKEKQEETVEATPQEQASAETTVGGRANSGGKTAERT